VIKRKEEKTNWLYYNFIIEMDLIDIRNNLQEI
jgi:hypothetical protein